MRAGIAENMKRGEREQSREEMGSVRGRGAWLADWLPLWVK